MAKVVNAVLREAVSGESSKQSHGGLGQRCWPCISFPLLLALFFLMGCGDDEEESLAVRISIAGCEQPLKLDEERELRAVFEPADFRNKTVRWNSSNFGVLEVNDFGIAKAVSLSEQPVRVSATAEGGEVGSCLMSIRKGGPSAWIESCAWGEKLSLQQGSEMKLRAHVETGKNVTWGVEDTKVAVVDEGGFLRGVAAGKTKVFLLSEGGQKEDSCEVEVSAVVVPLPVMESIEPTEAGYGATLTIQGRNFGTDMSKIRVTVGGIQVEVQNATDTRIAVVVPKNTSFHGLVQVEVGGEKAASARVLSFTYVQTAVVSTFAGKCGSQDGLGGQPNFRFPRGLAMDSAGSLYVADDLNHCIRKVTQQGTVSIFAGKCGVDYKGFVNSNSAGDSRFNRPQGIAIDKQNNLYVADADNYRIRMIKPSGAASTFAGTGKPGFVNGNRLDATFLFPSGIVMSGSGDLYVAELGNRIRMISSSGQVSHVAGIGDPGYIDGWAIYARLDGPYGIVRDKYGTLYVADAFNNSIRNIPNALVHRQECGSMLQMIDTFAGEYQNKYPGYFNAKGKQAKFNRPQGIAIDYETGNFYVADTENHVIRKITSEGVTTTIAGSGPNKKGYQDGKATSAQFNAPTGILVDPAGNLYVSDTNNHCIRKITFE